jgi:hypothetical protein
MVMTAKKNKGLFTGLGVIQLFIGLGAVGGGLALALAPSGSILGMPLEMLERTPFSNYLVPGIVLLVVIGLGNLAGSAASFTQHRNAAKTAIILGVFLVAWITLQVYWFADFHWLHALYLGLGLLEFVLGWSGFRARTLQVGP